MPAGTAEPTPLRYDAGMLTLLLVSSLYAQDAGLGLTSAADIDLDDAAANSLSYEGGLSGNAPAYGKGKPITVTHASGNVQVRCMDVESLSGRLQYTVFGSAEGAMESFGKGIGLAVWGDSNGGGVKTRIPSKPSGVGRAQVDLVVNIPRGTSAVTISQTGPGWVQMVECGGTVKISAGGGGAFASGPMTAATVSASGGDVKVVTDPATVLKGSTTISAGAGNVTVVLPSAQGGKLTAKGAEVSVQQTVMGTNEATLVSGDMGVAGPAITISAKKRAEVTQH